MSQKSDAERAFLTYWKILAPNFIEPIEEYKFASELGRRWRFDFAFPVVHPYLAGVAVEIEGGVFVQGRHTRGVGYQKDLEKYNAGATLGWIIYRFTPQMLKKDPTGCVEMVSQKLQLLRKRGYQIMGLIPVAEQGTELGELPLGLSLSSAMKFSEYYALGEKLAAIERLTPWYIGDFLVFGEKQFGEADYVAAESLFKLSINTLKRYKQVAQAFPATRRREQLSLEHHKAVLSLPAFYQQRCLNKATDKDWSATRLRKHTSALKKFLKVKSGKQDVGREKVKTPSIWDIKVSERTVFCTAGEIKGGKFEAILKQFAEILKQKGIGDDEEIQLTTRIFHTVSIQAVA